MDDFSAVDLELLRRFVAIASFRSFRRAATSLGISQPGLTRSIQQLETLFGTPLLERGSRGVGLTASGRVLLDQAPLLLTLAERVFRATKASLEVRRLNIGFSGLYGTLVKALSEFRTRWPGCELRMTQLTTSEQCRGLENGSIDVGFAIGMQEEQGGFDVEVLDVLGVSLAVPEHWDVARKASVSLAELAGLPFISAPREANPYRRNQLVARCRAAGFEPDVAHECRQQGDILKLVSIGMGVSLIAGPRPVPTKGVKYVVVDEDLSDMSSSLSMIWVGSKAGSVQQLFLDSVRATFAARQAKTAPGPTAP